MQYLILAYETDDAFEARDDPARAGAYWDAWSGYLLSDDAEVQRYLSVRYLARDS